jgi:C1A family cysteine protease
MSLKKVFLFAALILSAARLSAQNHRGPTNAMGQITRPHKGKLLEMKSETEIHNAQPLRAVDLSPWAPKPVWQSYKNCYAYATVYTARTLLYNVTHDITNSPDSTVFSPGFLQKLIYPKRAACKSHGDDTYSACQYLEDVGVVFRKDYPNDCTSDPVTQDLRDKAKAYRIKAEQLYEKCAKTDNKIAAIKASLMRHYPVVVAWLSEDSFNGGGYNLELWTPTPNDLKDSACGSGANHAICIIGYNDDKFGGAFQIQNSWRLTWGKGDRIWIKYGDMAQFSKYAIELSEITQ